MADLEKIIKLIFEGDGTGLNRELQKMDDSVHGFNEKIQNATGPLGDFGEKVAYAEGALIALGAAGLAYAYGKAKEFESGVIELDKVLGDDDGLAGGLDLAKQKAIELSDEYGESAKNVISSIADFKQANFSLTDSILLAEDAMRLKIAGDLDAAEASEYLKRILSGFRAEASDSTVVIDSMNAVSNKYNTNVRELAIGLGDLSGVAKTVNMNYAETEGILTPVIAVFGSGSEAANALKTGLIRLIDNAKPVVDALSSIGVSQRGVNGELKNAYDILGEVARAFEKTDKSQQLFIAGEIFGKEQAAKMVQVISDWDQVLAVTETALNSTGSAQEEVTKRLLSAEVAVNRAAVGWENLFAAIGGKFANEATGTVNALTDIENALRKSLGQEAFDPVWLAINDFFSKTKELLSSIAKNLPEALEGVDFNKLIDAFKGLGEEVGVLLDDIFGGGLDLTTVDGLENAVQKIVNIATAMTNFTTGFISGLEPLAKTVGAVVGGIDNMDAKGQEMAGKVSGWAKSIDTLTGSFDMLRLTLVVLAGTNLVTATVALIAFAAPLAGIALGIGAAAAAVGLFLKGLDALGVVDMGSVLDDIKSGFEKIKGMFSDEESQPKLKPKLIPISTQETEDAFWGVNEGIKALEDNPIKLTVDGSDLVKTEVLLDDLLSIPIIESGIDVPIWAKLEAEALQKDIENAAAGATVKVAGQMSFDGKTWVDVEEDIKKPIDKPVEVKPTILEQAKIDLERELNAVDNQAKTVQTAMEWKAKIDIADIEASSNQAVAAFDSIGASVVETSGDIANMFSDLASNMNNMRTSDKWFMMDRLKEAQEKNNELIDAQVDLTERQAEYMRLRNEKLDSGNTAEIKIDTTGVEPALELVMWQIIEKVQIRANENAQDFLLGLPTI